MPQMQQTIHIRIWKVAEKFLNIRSSIDWSISFEYFGWFPLGLRILLDLEKGVTPGEALGSLHGLESWIEVGFSCDFVQYWEAGVDGSEIKYSKWPFWVMYSLCMLWTVIQVHKTASRRQVWCELRAWDRTQWRIGVENSKIFKWNWQMMMKTIWSLHRICWTHLSFSHLDV